MASLFNEDPFSFAGGDLKEWPRRLLFVPEMRSYERQPGNIYKDEAEPSYNILSYTWGCWQLDVVHPGTSPALRVHGIPWAIPLVSPEVFTVERFEAVLRHVGDRGVDWVWVDVACIDQGDPLVRDEEIGRQVGIFNNAANAFVWLHHSPRHDLQRFADVLFEMADRAQEEEGGALELGSGHVSIERVQAATGGREYVSNDRWPQEVLNLLDIMTRDPWFSSLWTLQEAYLRGDAKILSKEGDELERSGYDSVALASFTTAWAKIERAIRWAMKQFPRYLSSGTSRYMADILKQLERTGLLAIDNPVLLYSAASFRQASKEDDRIYGIMQVFGFKLGKSIAPGTQYSLPELEVQFANALVAKSPVWAQLFVHTQSQPPGRHWCISQSVKLPESLQFVVTAPKSQCSISMGSDGSPVFFGQACTFRQIGRAWQETRLLPPRSTFWGSESETCLRPVQTIALDVCQFVEDNVPADLRRPGNELSDVMPKLTEFLMQTAGDYFSVFLLGKLRSLVDDDSIEDEGDSDDEAEDASVGLLVHPISRNGGKRLWQRVGIAVWARLPMIDSAPIDWHRVTAMLD